MTSLLMSSLAICTTKSSSLADGLPHTPRLLQLPTELLQRIAYLCHKISDETLFHFRASCRSVEFVTRDDWKKEHFKRRNLRLEVGKLRELEEVSKVPEFAELVSRLRVQCWKGSIFNDDGESVSVEEKRSLRCLFQNLRNVTEVQFIDCSEHMLEVTGGRERSNDVPIDYLTNFAAVVEAVQDCELPVTAVLTTLSEHYPTFGMRDCAALAKISGSLANTLTTLELHLFFQFGHGGSVAEWVKRREEIATGLVSLKKLKRLRLRFEGAVDVSSGLDAIRRAASLPQLEAIELDNFDCEFDAVVLFLRAYRRSLRDVSVTKVRLEDVDFEGVMQDSKAFLEELGVQYNLTKLCVEDVDMGDYSLAFPGVCTVSFEDVVDEDGYIEVETNPTELCLEGADLERQVVRAHSCLTWIASPYPSYKAG